MTLLTTVQDACLDLGIDSPSSVIGNTDAQVKQLLAIANREGKDLASRFGWSKLVKENTFTMVATASQGALNSTVVTDGDFDYLLSGTVWNRTTNLPIIGSTEEGDWQLLQSFTITGPFERYRIQGGNFYVDPVPTAGHTLAFEYKSKWWCESSGGSGQAKWAADADVGRLDEDLMTLGIIWRWKSRKGLDYLEDMRTYESRVTDAMSRDKPGKNLSLNGNFEKRYPGTLVPKGSWSLP